MIQILYGPWKKLEFSVFSSANSIELMQPSTLKFVPATCNLVQLRQAVELARHVPDKQPVIIVLFHRCDFREYDKGRSIVSYKEFLALMTWITSQQDIRIRTIGETAMVISDINDLRFINNFSFRQLSVLTPPIRPLYENLLPAKVYFPHLLPAI